MTFSAVGTFIDITTATTINPTGVGNLVLLPVISESNTVYATGVSGGNCTWTEVGTKLLGSASGIAYYSTLWLGVATATGSAAYTVTYSGTKPTVRGGGQQFASSVGSYTQDGSAGNIDSGSTNTYSSLTPAKSGDLYFGYAFWNGTCTNGSTSGYVYQQETHSNGLVYNVNCGSGAQAPVWGSSAPILGNAVLFKELPTTSSGLLMSCFP